MAVLGRDSLIEGRIKFGHTPDAKCTILTIPLRETSIRYLTAKVFFP